MPGPDPYSLPTMFGLFAYGPAPGIELIPYFLGLLAWMGLALGAVLLSPITALLRLLRRGKGAPRSAPPPTNQPSPDKAPE